jgi:hypothetical protein
MDFDKIERLHTTLSTTLLMAGTEEEATPVEVLTAVMRTFSYLVAAYVSGTNAVQTDVAVHAAIDTHCREAAALAKARLREVRDYEPFESNDEDTEPA